MKTTIHRCFSVFALTGAFVVPVMAQIDLEREPGVDRAKSAQQKRWRAQDFQRSQEVRVTTLGNFALKENETVAAVVVIGGTAEINGTVEGALVVIDGTAKLGPTAENKNELVLIGSTLEADPAAMVGKHQVMIASSGGQPGLALWQRLPQAWIGKELSWGRQGPHHFGWACLLAGVALLSYLLIAALFPRQVQAGVDTLQAQAGRSFLLGLLVIVLTAPVLLLLVVTGIGLLIVPFLLIAMAAILVFAKVIVYGYAGQQIGGQFGGSVLKQPLVALVVGTLLFYLLFAIPVIGFVVWGAVLPLGIGAVLKALFKRSEPKASAVAPAAPPMLPGGVPAAAVAGEPPPLGALLPRAGFWLRLSATLLDFLLVVMICLALRRPQWFFLLWVIYHLGFWTWKSTTAGGIICGIKIVRSNGSPLNFGTVLLRLLASFFSLAVLGLGFFWAGWTRDKQSWHDKIADTIIVKLPKSAPVTYPPTRHLPSSA